MGGTSPRIFRGTQKVGKQWDVFPVQVQNQRPRRADGGSTLEASRPETQKHQASVQGQRQAKASVPAQMPPGRGIPS